MIVSACCTSAVLGRGVDRGRGVDPAVQVVADESSEDSVLIGLASTDCRATWWATIPASTSPARQNDIGVVSGGVTGSGS